MFDFRALTLAIITLVISIFALSRGIFEVPTFEIGSISDLGLQNFRGVFSGDSSAIVQIEATYSTSDKFWRYFFNPVSFSIYNASMNFSGSYVKLGGSNLKNGFVKMDIGNYKGLIEISDSLVIKGKGDVKIDNVEMEQASINAKITNGEVKFTEINGFGLKIFDAYGNMKTSLGKDSSPTNVSISNSTVVIGNFDGSLYLNLDKKTLVLDGKIGKFEVNGIKKLKLE
jgi:hypothetical protein